ncbi:MAG: alpha/beta hydrolase, partial [Exilispira sp.]
ANLAVLLYKKYTKIEKKLIKKEKNIKIILLAPAFSVNNKVFPSFFEILKGFLLRKEFKFKSKNPGCNNPEYINFYKNYHNSIPAKRFFDLYILIKMGKKYVKYIDIPILIIHSKKDLISPFNESLKIFKKIDSKLKIFITLSKSNHFIQLDYERTEVYELSKGFIEKGFNNFIKESTTSATTA